MIALNLQGGSAQSIFLQLAKVSGFKYNFMRVIIIIVLFLIVLCGLNQNKLDRFITTKKVCSSDARCYPVVSYFPEPETAAEMLVYLNQFSIGVMRYMRQKYLFDAELKNDSSSLYYKHITNNLLANYNPDNITENDPKDLSLTSFVEDKGKVFALCLRDKKSGTNAILDKNILEFVAMHEMGHMATDKIGHDHLDFWMNFKIIIDAAVNAGLHTPVNYEKTPVNYCGLNVDYNPYFDNEIPL